MVNPIKLFSFTVWKNFIRLTEEPSEETSKTKLSRLVAVVCYILSIIAAAVVTYQGVIFADDIQSVNPTDWQKSVLPDAILCPRPGIAVVILPKPPTKNETEENPDDYSEKYVRWRDGPLPVKRLRQHERYENHVWYNLQILEMLNMTQTHVNQFTRQVKEDPDFESKLDPEFSKYMAQLRNWSKNSYQHDIKELDSNNRFDNQLQWQLPIHPRLQELLATDTNEKKEKQLFWWAIIKTQYVMKYSDTDTQSQNYVKNGRFNCLGVDDCQVGYSAIWLDDSYCMMWSGYQVGWLAMYQPGFIEDIQFWAGSAKMQHIKWQDFLLPAIDPETGWTISGRGKNKQSAMRIETRSFRTVAKSENNMLPAVCQSMIDKPQNNASIRSRFCDKGGTLQDDYLLYQRMSYSLHYHYMVEQDQSQSKTLMVSPQYSGWQLLGVVGGTFGLICGLSVLQLIQIMVIKLRKKIQMAIQITLGLVLFVLATWGTVYDVIDALDADGRYLDNPYVTPAKSVPIPTISLRGYTYWSQMTLNHTKLAEYRVSPQLHRYLCITATGTICGSDNKIHGSDPFKQRERFMKFWDHPYEQLFVTIRPNSTLLGSIEQEYSELAKQVEPTFNVETDPAYTIFKHFLLDPCSIVLECQIGTNTPYKCCNEFMWRPHHEEMTMYNLYWSNPNDLTFAEGTFAVFFDTNQYLTHSDGLAPYLGPGVSLDAATTGVNWKHNNLGYLSFASKNGGPSSRATNVGSYVTSSLGNGHQSKVVFRAKPDKQLTMAEYSGSTCLENPKCTFQGAAYAYMRFRAIERLCPCQLKYSESFMIPLNSTKKFCTAREAMSCFMDDRFFTGFCRNRPDLGDFKVPSFKWNSNDTKKYDMVNPNVLFFAYDWNYACGWQALWTDSTSPLGNTISSADLQTCTKPRSCLRYEYEKKPGVTRWTYNTQDKSKGFKLLLSIYESVEPGVKQIDTFDLPGIIGFSLNSFGLFFGLSLLALMHIVHLVIGKCRSRNKKDVAKKVQQHWKRSMGFVRAANAVQVGPASQISNAGSVEEEEVETPNLSHVLLITISTLSLIVLIVIVVQAGPSITDSSLSSYKVHFNSTDIEPALALCTKKEPALSINDELDKLEGCSYHNRSVSCDKLFPLVWRPSYNEENGVVACAVTNQLLHNTKRTQTIDLKKALYNVENIGKSAFTQVHFGELSTLADSNAENPLLFYDLATNQERTQIRFSTKKYRSIEGCVTKSFPSLTKCADVVGKRREEQLCLEQASALSDLPEQSDDCLSIEYEYRALTDGTGMVSFLPKKLDNDQQIKDRRGLEVYYADYVWLDITQRPKYSWQLRLTLLGGYVDQMIGISILNILFVFVWFGIGGLIKKVKGLIIKPKVQPNAVNVIQVQPRRRSVATIASAH